MDSLDLLVLRQVRDWRAAGHSVWLVTVIETWGSAPRPPGALLAVRDDGAGFDSSSTAKRASLGLASMRERVRILDGRFAIESGPGIGTSLSAWLPLQAVV